MIRYKDNKRKSASVYCKSEYDLINEGLMNPYCYNFGLIERFNENYNKLHHINKEDL